jgi:glycosyltransferase involved in cell wall biosynthesis
MIPHIPKTSDFLFLGRLVSDKGADVAIQAFYRLITEADGLNMADMTLTIVGDGPDREYLRYMVSEFGLEKNIVFTGALTGETLVNCLNRHRYMIVPSRWAEPFGIVALEGMACGCLPIVSNGGGLPDAVGQAGLLFKQADVDSLFSCIRRILGSPEEEKRIREAAPAHLAAFSSVDVSKRYLSLFEQVISNRNN